MKHAVPQTVAVNYQPYIKRGFLSQAETRFYNFLRQLLSGRYLIFTKVRIGDLIQPAKPEDKKHLSKINSKHVDFVVCDRVLLQPKIIVELDDKSHDKPDRKARDRFVDEAFANAGIPIVHIKAKGRYDKEEITEQIRQAYRTRYRIRKEKPGFIFRFFVWTGSVAVITLLLVYFF